MSTPGFEGTLQEWMIHEDVLDKNSNWWFLNRLWFKPENRKIFTEYFTKFLNSILTQNPLPCVLTPEGLSSTFGILPFISVYIDQKECPLLIWKEVGDLVTVKPFIFPDPEKMQLSKQQLSIVVIQDVVGSGSIIRKIYSDLQTRGYPWIIESLITVIHLKDKNVVLTEFLEEISTKQNKKIEFYKMLEW